MAGYHQTIAIGNLVADPELRYSQSGTALCNFRIAVNRTWTDSSTGEKREKVTYFRVTAWRGLAETCNQYLRKGAQVTVIGEIDASAYMKDDEPRASLELTAKEVVFGGKRDEQPAEAGEQLPF